MIAPGPRRAVIFDLDGTLVDSLGDIADAMNATLAARRFPGHPEDAYRAMIGDGVLALARRVLPVAVVTDALAREVVVEYRARYAQAMTARTRPYPGIEPLLDALTARGIALAVLSNKSHEATAPLVEASFPGRFARAWGERVGMPRKPDPTAALALAGELGVPAGETLFVGDSAIDVETALRAGMGAVGVAWGFRGADELARAGAQVIVTEAAEILTLVEASSGT